MYVTMQCKCASIPDTHYIVTLWVHLMFFLNKNESTKKIITAENHSLTVFWHLSCLTLYFEPKTNPGSYQGE